MKYASFISHIAAAIIITAIILLVYASVQQAHRSSANDTQLQIARDVSNALSKGKSINRLIIPDTIDIAQSLAVFTELFDKSGKPVQSTGFLNGQLPQLPQGIFDFTNNNNEDVLTWQPQSNVRMALVCEKVDAAGVGFVAVGRSLKETEEREGNLVKMIAITWVACMAVLLIHFLLLLYFKRSEK